MSALILPKRGPAASTETELLKGNFVQSIDAPLPDPDLLPEPHMWRIMVMAVGMRRTSRGGIMLPDETLDVQNWTHPLFKICKVGPFVMRGKVYEQFDPAELDAMRPKPGELWWCAPKNPERVYFDGALIINITDDGLKARVKPEAVERLRFNNGFEL